MLENYRKARLLPCRGQFTKRRALSTKPFGRSPIWLLSALGKLENTVISGASLPSQQPNGRRRMDDMIEFGP